ncbi:MAG: sugar-binding transcriptional regulator [Actinobacteria bacterium]|nr:sugar-binding transcriptional regulator [Actinomycetota bacterium]MBM3713189.1 sugar-binding transcriptional regulator [Actinomycetota bacterium]
MNKLEQQKLLSKISRQYYLEDITQQEIAERLNISRTRVSRYLTRAKKEKIVEIKINSAWERYEELESKVEKLFSIKECHIVPSFDEQEEIYRQMAVSLSNILERILENGSYLGVGWGVTLRTVSNYLEPDRKLDIKIIPLLGGLGKVGIEVHTNSVSKTLADKYGGVSYVIHSPAVLDSREAREILEKDSNTREIIEMMDLTDAAVIGMSDIGPGSTMIKTGNFKAGEFSYLEKHGVVGDVNLIFIDKSGKQVKSEIDQRIIRVPLEKLKKIKNVVGIAYGSKKVKVIRGALLGKIINILITDEKTAGELLL